MAGACKRCGCAYGEGECATPQKIQETPTVLCATVKPPGDLHLRVLMPYILEMCPEATFDTGADGEIVIYTGYREVEDSLVPIPKDT